MGALTLLLYQRISNLLEKQKVLVWYDTSSEFLQWVSQLIGSRPLEEITEPVKVSILNAEAWLVPFRGSYYELLRDCEPITDDSGSYVLVYIPGEPYLEHLSPIRELECLSGEREPLQLELRQVAREAFRQQGLSEGKIDELLNRDGLSFEYLDAVPAAGDATSPLVPVFGSSREVEVIPLFLSRQRCRRDVAEKGLLPEVAKVVEQGLGLRVSQRDDPEEMASELARLLLVAEMRGDLNGPEPVAISQLPKPATNEQQALVRQVCQRFRGSYPDEYEAAADQVERSLGLAEQDIDPLSLGKIDTFRFEEKALLGACDSLLEQGYPDDALKISRERAQSFWTSIQRHPARHAAWRSCETLARLQSVMSSIKEGTSSTKDDPKAWVKAYTAPEGWHLADKLFREARFTMTQQSDDELGKAPSKILAQYDELIDSMTTGFTKALAAKSWQVNGLLQQTEVFSKKVQSHQGPVAYLMVDALRFEMGMSLLELLRAVGAEDAHIDQAVASVPTITDVGMVGLLPGAERSFSLAEGKRAVVGCIDGKALESSLARMDHAKAKIPGLKEMTMDHLLYEAAPKELKQAAQAPVLIVRSQEIDGSGESLPSGVARKVMGTVLEDVRKAVLRLAEHGVEHFVITADHGHLFGGRKGEEMRIDPPEGGTAVDLHRRCWVGRGGSTPPSCHRAPLKDLGYQTDLDLVVPKGAGVFKASGDLAYHHGGLSLQELIIPVISCSLKGRAKKGKRGERSLVALSKAPNEVTNPFFSINIKRTDLPTDPLMVYVLAVEARSGRTVGQSGGATRGWDPDRHQVALTDNEMVSVVVQLIDESVSEIRVLVMQVGTNRALKDTQPIPVKLLR